MAEDARTVPPTGVFAGAKLIYSLDDGTTWHNQDGSSPVTWESGDARTRATMAFWRERDHAFSLISLLQMGRAYEANTDGYVYAYSPNGSREGTMNELVMFRVATDRIPDRSAYEYFAGRDDTGAPAWSTRSQLPYAWMPSVTYNIALDLYLMTSWGMGGIADGRWFGTPSYLGFWTAPHPWGPWTQVFETTDWTPGGDTEARCYQPQIAPAWMSDDGTSLWLIWSDFQMDGTDDPFARMAGTATDPGEFMRLMWQSMPGYTMHLQRVDLEI